MKDYIAFMKKLCDAGLLETSGQGNEKKAENKVSMISSWWISTWDEPGVIVKEGQAAPYFVGTLCRGVEGIDPLVTRQNGIQKGTYEYAVTSNADKAAIGKLLDYLASEEYSVLSEFGIEGYTYEVTEDGKKKKLPANDISEVQIMSKLPALWVNNSILPRVEVTDRAQELITCEEPALRWDIRIPALKKRRRLSRISMRMKRNTAMPLWIRKPISRRLRKRKRNG